MHICVVISIFLVTTFGVLLSLLRGSEALKLDPAHMLAISWLIALLDTMLLYESWGWGGLGVGIEGRQIHLVRRSSPLFLLTEVPTLESPLLKGFFF